MEPPSKIIRKFSGKEQDEYFNYLRDLVKNLKDEWLKLIHDPTLRHFLNLTSMDPGCPNEKVEGIRRIDFDGFTTNISTLVEWSTYEPSEHVKFSDVCEQFIAHNGNKIEMLDHFCSVLQMMNSILNTDLFIGNHVKDSLLRKIAFYHYLLKCKHPLGDSRKHYFDSHEHFRNMSKIETLISKFNNFFTDGIKFTM